MLKKLVVLIVLGVVSAFFAARADDKISRSGPARAMPEIKKIEVIVPVAQSVNEPAADVLINELLSMEKARFVYLDLSIYFSDKSNGSVPFSRTIKGKPEEGPARGCSIGPLLMSTGVSYELGPIANYNHLLMSVFTADRSTSPYNDISCEYKASDNQTIFRIRGFFHVIANSIPTAVALQLRPFNPPFDVAARTLKGK